MNFTIVLFYKYIHIDDPKGLAESQREKMTRLNLKGRVIVAHEGINATCEGTDANIETYLSEFLADPRFYDTQIKKSRGTGDAFPKISVKERKEIVSLGLGQNDVDPTRETGKRLSPDELKSWYKTKKSGEDFYIIDMRNTYEQDVGHFDGSVLPKVTNFRDIPSIMPELEHLKDKTVVPVCTGGVRCEKASAYLLSQGFKDVYQLDGGIVSYMEKYPTEDFKGTLYVFDRRITMDFDDEGKHTVVGKCFLCQSLSEKYVNCRNPKCNKHFIVCNDCNEKSVYCGKECESVMALV